MRAGSTRPGRRAYRRSLGLVELVCLGIGGTIGSGIFIVPGSAARIAGPASLLAWAIVAASACAVAYALAALQARSPSGTTFAALFVDAFGRPVAAGLVALYVVSSVLGIATITAGLGDYLAYFGLRHRLAIEVSVVGAFLVVNALGVALSGATENALSLVKLGALALIVAVLVPFVRGANLAPAPVPSAAALLQAAVIVYWSFTGFEISAIPVGETKDPRRIGRALLLVMVLVCGVYLALNVALIGAVGAADLAASPAPVAHAVARVIPGAGPLVAAVGIVTMLSALNAYLLGTSRALRDGALLFGVTPLARLSRRGVPGVALVTAGGLATLLLLVSDRFDALAAASVVATLLPYVGICVAAGRHARTGFARAVAWGGALVTAAILVLYFVP